MMNFVFSILMDRLPCVLLVMASFIVVFTLYWIAIRCIGCTQRTAFSLIVLVLEAASALVVWWGGGLSQNIGLVDLVYYSRIPVGGQPENRIPELWVILQILKATIFLVDGRTLGALLRHAYLLPVGVYWWLHSGGVTTRLLASIVVFHVVDVVVGIHMLLITWEISNLVTKALAAGLWFNWRVWFYKDLVFASAVDAALFTVPMCAQLVIGIGLLV